MKKKVSIREQREAKQASIRTQHSQVDKARSDAEKEKKRIEEEAKRIEEEAKRIEAKKQSAYEEMAKRAGERKFRFPERAASEFNGTKSLVKANGLKSVLILKDRTVITSFGRGNDANLEYEVVNGATTELNTEKHVFRLTDDDSSKQPEYKVARNTVKVSKPGTLAKNECVVLNEAPVLRDGLIGNRKKLEQRYFGGTFRDNIHIQVIHNIMDIEKHLSQYANNAIYALNNVVMLNSPTDLEAIGNVGTDEKHSVTGIAPQLLKQLKSSKRALYFGPLFYTGLSGKKENKENAEQLREDVELCAIVEMLGGLRQYLVHGGKSNASWLFRLDEVLKPRHKAILDKLYGETVDKLNKDFIRQSQKDLTAAIEVFGARTIKDKNEIVSDYYCHVVRKDTRNMGASIRILREIMIDDKMSGLRSTKFDSTRSKVNRMLDFVLYRYYKAHDDELAAFVEVLRSGTFNGEKADQERQKAYLAEGRRLWKAVEGKCKDVIKLLGNGNAIKTMAPDSDVKYTKVSIGNVMVDAGNTTYFTKLMYMLCMLLDGKEINELLSGLLNKLENIASFLSVMKRCGMKGFTDGNYLILNDAQRLADEIRIAKSFVRMEKPSAGMKMNMLLDAAQLLGVDGDEALHMMYNDKFFECKEMTEEELMRYYPGYTVRKGQQYKFDRNKFFQTNIGLRNFMARNVVDSRRFQYIIRYANPGTVRKFAECAPLVRYTLERIPDEQLFRYCVSCFPNERFETKEERVAKLQHTISNLSFRDFEKVKTGNDIASNQMMLKQRLTAVVGLYLTVLYLITKNLVNINARYTIAIHCYERDMNMLANVSEVFKEKKLLSSYYKLVDAYLDGIRAEKNEAHGAYDAWHKGGKVGPKPKQKRYNGHALKTIEINRNQWNAENQTYNDEVGAKLLRLFRNAVMHMNAVNAAATYVDDIAMIDSYFALYHYVMQRYLIDKTYTKEADIEEANEKSAAYVKYIHFVKEHHVYNKDCLKGILAPIAYNLPRFKNLTIADLFDKNEAPANSSEKEVK